MNYKHVLFLTLLLSLPACSPTQSPATEEEQNTVTDAKKEFNVEDIDKRVMQMHMDRVDAYVKWLRTAIKKKNWDKISLYTQYVDSLGELLLSENADTKNIPQKFFEIDQRFKESIDFIIDASEKKDLKTIRIEYERMQNTCKQCHTLYRK